MLDIFVIIFTLLLGYWGYKRGLVKTAMSLTSYILSLFLAWTLYLPVSDYLHRTRLMPIIMETVSKNIVAPSSPQFSAESLHLPAIFDSFIQSNINAPVAQAGSAIVIGISSLIVNIIAMIIAFFLCKIIILILGKFLNIFTRIPVIKQFNKLGGFALGIIQGLLITYLIFAIITIFTPINSNRSLQKLIDDSGFSKNMYYNNMLFSVFK